MTAIESWCRTLSGSLERSSQLGDELPEACLCGNAELIQQLLGFRERGASRLEIAGPTLDLTPFTEELEELGMVAVPELCFTCQEEVARFGESVLTASEQRQTSAKSAGDSGPGLFADSYGVIEQFFGLRKISQLEQ